MAAAPNEKGAVNDGMAALAVSLFGLSTAVPSASSSHVVWSASSYAIPHTGQSPVFSFGLLLAAVAVVDLLVDAAVGAVNEGNVNAAAEEVDDALLLLLPNVNGVVGTDDDGAVVAGVPKLNDGSDGVLAAVDDEDDRAGVEVPKVNGATGVVLVAAGAVDLLLRLSLLVSVAGLLKGVGLCLLSSSSSTGRRLRLNDEDERVDASILLAEEVKGAMNGADEEEEEAEEEEAEDDTPLMEYEMAGGEGAKVGTAGRSVALLLLCTPRSLATSLSFSCSLTLLSCTLLVLFLSSLSSATSSFSSFSFSFSLTTTAGSCKLLTAVMAPPVPAAAPNPNFRVGSNLPRSDDRERGEADVAAV